MPEAGAASAKALAVRPDRKGSPTLRRARPHDLDALHRLEQAAFEAPRRASRASLRRSLSSSRQEVWLLDDGSVVAALVLWLHPASLRIYDIAVHPNARGEGLGTRMLAHAEAVARARGADRLLLEADEARPELLSWYRAHGFVAGPRRTDYYGAVRHAVRMLKVLRPP